MQRFSMSPLRYAAHMSKHVHANPMSPLSYTNYGRKMLAGMELVERMTRRYGKPEFGITETEIDGKPIKVHDEIVQTRDFCDLRHFVRHTKNKAVANQPKILLVAPMSGHHATLLRGTVEGLLPHADVYITDWVDARETPMHMGDFDLHDYISYLIDFITLLGDNVHTMAVCQPSVPLYAAVALMSAYKDPCTPLSMTLMGGPIDTRANPTQVNQLAMDKPLSWFEQNVVSRVPANYPGFMKRVYPGFMQLTGFMTMNLERHIGEHVKLFNHLVEGDGESADSHKEFYDEYLSVCDLDAAFYLQTIEKVFQKHLLPKGEFDYKGDIIKPEAITKTAILCIEGEKDDISGVGQTKSALDISTGLADSKKRYHLQEGVGHYGIFNGRRYRKHIVPVIIDHMNAAVKK